ncbi:hypothetical protein D9758_005045 [Tetrapyrgos nigripes]|uniref:Cap-specific mRNA (nucleoside-2'-O-)-methyltransferase 1 n=1 Tax=Tetrapyrgos nigripes TaxID=182062 RepID=A0A8H5LWI6_9AGAR|nr:hypothetical protein D9758_005045 [Tetrapyrgos nigripes]
MFNESYKLDHNLGAVIEGLSISTATVAPRGPKSPVSPIDHDSGSETQAFPSSFSDTQSASRDERGQAQASNDTFNRMWKLSDQLIARGASDLEYLLKLKKKGWQDENLDNYFAQERHVADNASAELNSNWYRKMQKVFGEIDRATECIPRSQEAGSFRFLDLGCCPGGFSSYILKKNKNATGVGISLPVDQGGYDSALEEGLLERFTLHFVNLTKYNLAVDPATATFNSSTGTTGSAFLRLEDQLGASGPSKKFDLILLGCSHVRKNDDIRWEVDQLLLSQLVIALGYIRPGGKIVMKMSIMERILTSKTIRFFDLLCERVETVKPLTMHAKRGSFYLVAHGVGRGVEGHRQEEFLTKLKEIWEELTFGGQDGTGRFLNLEDFDFVVTTEELKDSERSGEFLDKLVELGRKVWQGQIKGLEGLFRAENAKHTDRGRRPSRGGRGFWRGEI